MIDILGMQKSHTADYSTSARTNRVSTGNGRAATSTKGCFTTNSDAMNNCETEITQENQKVRMSRGNQLTKQKSFILLSFVLLILGVGIMSCKKDKPNPDEPDNPNSGGGTETGLYMGIIGFNDNISTKEIGLLTSNNKSGFQSFVSDLPIKDGTGLYYAVDNAINKLQAATLPNDLVNVSIVTFTDGLDNVSIDLNTKYGSRDAYRDAVQGRIKNTKIKGLNINAYSIGIKGGDVVDVNAFRAGLTALASNPNNAKEVTSMDEVNNTFKDIANSLYAESQTQSIKLKMTSGYDNGTKIRFTFDNSTDAAQSSMYIEGTYDRQSNPRTLKNVVYHGLNSSSGTTVSGELNGVFITWTFENVSDASGGTVTVSEASTHQWEYVVSSSQWQRNIEFGKDGDVATVVERKSAVIILVLDCTSSLDAGGANGSSQMKKAANNFIDILAGTNPPSTPTGLTAVQVGDEIKVSWNSVDKVTNYNVYYSNLSNPNKTFKLELSTANTEFKHTPAVNGVNRYRISAVNAYGESVQSDIVTCSYSPNKTTQVQVRFERVLLYTYLESMGLCDANGKKVGSGWLFNDNPPIHTTPYLIFPYGNYAPQYVDSYDGKGWYMGNQITYFQAGHKYKIVCSDDNNNTNTTNWKFNITDEGTY